MTLRISALLAFALLAASAADLKPVSESTYAPKVVAPARGKVLLVNFWATYCVPCRKEMPQLVALAAKYQPRGLSFITVSADEPEQAKDASAFLDKAKVPAPCFLRKADDDEAFIKAVDPKWPGALPATFLYEKTGRRVQSFFGELKLADLESAIQKLL